MLLILLLSILFVPLLTKAYTIIRLLVALSKHLTREITTLTLILHHSRLPTSSFHTYFIISLLFPYLFYMYYPLVCREKHYKYAL